MTRKEEIREYATKAKRVADEYGFKTVHLDLILELTAPESSPAPLESQEELWGEFDCDLNNTRGSYPAAKSKWILTRRTEGKGRKEGDLQE